MGAPMPPIRFDPCLEPRAGSGLAAVAKAVQGLIPIKHNKLLRKERRRQIGALVANLAVARLTGSERVQVTRSRDYYKTKNVYRHSFVEAESFPLTLAQMEEVGLLAFDHGAKKKRVTMMWAAANLDNLFRSHSFSLADICEANDGPVIFLGQKEKRDQSTPDREPKTKLVQFEWDQGPHDLREMKRRIRVMNAWYDTLKIRYEGMEPGVIKRHPYRRFTETFEEHGRFYGASWITWPADKRWKMLVYDKRLKQWNRLVQLNLGAGYASILYAQKRETPPDEPYEVPKVVQAYEDCGYPDNEAKRLARRAAEAVVKRRLCDWGPRRTYWRDDPDDEPVIWPQKVMTCRKLIEAVCEHLPLIAPEIGPDRDGPPKGMALCKQESDIILATLDGCREQDIPAFPAHDAILVARTDYHRVGSIMAQRFFMATRSYPIIKATIILTPSELERISNPLAPVTETLKSMDGIAKPQWSADPAKRLSTHNLPTHHPTTQEERYVKGLLEAFGRSDEMVPQLEERPTSINLRMALREWVDRRAGVEGRGVTTDDVNEAMLRSAKESVLFLRRLNRLEALGRELGFAGIQVCLQVK
jgi:hypothetical protein